MNKSHGGTLLPLLFVALARENEATFTKSHRTDISENYRV